MSGFVYIWFDRKHNRYYVGSHWGPENDGYICSSTNMRNNYNNRPQDFKRRILSRIITSRLDLFNEEQRWLDMIKPYEVGRKYYNLNTVARGFGKWANEEVTKKVSQKISHKLMGNTNGSYKWTDEQKAKNKSSYQYERTSSQKEVLKKGREKGQQNSPITKKGWIPKHRIGTKHKPETVARMRQARLDYYANKKSAASGGLPRCVGF